MDNSYGKGVGDTKMAGTKGGTPLRAAPAMKQAAQSTPRGVGQHSPAEDEMRRALIRGQGSPAARIAQIARDNRARMENGGKSKGSPAESRGGGGGGSQARVPAGQPGGGEFAKK